MGQALVRSKNVDAEDFQVVFTVQMIIGIVIYSMFFVVAPWFSIWFDNPMYTDLLRVSAISFLLRPFINIHSSWLNREMMFKERTLVGFISAIIGSVISIVMAFSGYGVWSLIIGGLSGSVILMFLISRLTPNKIYPIIKKSKVKKYAVYGAKVSGNDIINYTRKEVSNLIISRIGGASLVGIFNKANSLGKLPFTTISAAAYQPVMREMSKVQDNLDQSRYLFLKMISLLVIYTLPVYLGLFFLAEPFIYVVYGEKWMQVVEPLRILSLAGLSYCIGHPCGAILAAHDRLGREMIVQFIGLVLIGLTTYFGLQWGLSGVAWGILGTEVISAGLMYYLVVQAIQVNLRSLIKTITPGLILNGILLLVLFVLSGFFSEKLDVLQSVYYMMLAAFFGGGAYILFFLFLPLESISSESMRWKRALKIES